MKKPKIRYKRGYFNMLIGGGRRLVLLSIFFVLLSGLSTTAKNLGLFAMTSIVQPDQDLPIRSRIGIPSGQTTRVDETVELTTVWMLVETSPTPSVPIFGSGAQCLFWLDWTKKAFVVDAFITKGGKKYKFGVPDAGLSSMQWDGLHARSADGFGRLSQTISPYSPSVFKNGKPVGNGIEDHIKFNAQKQEGRGKSSDNPIRVNLFPVGDVELYYKNGVLVSKVPSGTIENVDVLGEAIYEIDKSGTVGPYAVVVGKYLVAFNYFNEDEGVRFVGPPLFAFSPVAAPENPRRFVGNILETLVKPKRAIELRRRLNQNNAPIANEVERLERELAGEVGKLVGLSQSEVNSIYAAADPVSASIEELSQASKVVGNTAERVGREIERGINKLNPFKW